MKSKKYCVECGKLIKGFGFLHHFVNRMLKTTFYCARCYHKLGRPKPLTLREIQNGQNRTTQGTDPRGVDVVLERTEISAGVN